MKQKNRTFLALCACLVIGANADAQTMTLRECINMGIERNLQLNSQRIDIQKGETQIKQSRALLLPQVSGSIQVIDYLKNPVQVSGSGLLGMDFPDPQQWGKVRTMPYTSQAMLQAQMPLFNQNIRAAIEKDYANSTLQLSQNQHIFNTQSRNHQQAQSVYNLTERRYKEGVSSMTSHQSSTSACRQA